MAKISGQIAISLKIIVYCAFFMFVIMLSGCSGDGESRPTDPKTVSEQAYIFAYPMLQNYQTLYSQVIAPRPSDAAAKFNQFKHGSHLMDYRFTDVVRPNNDTLYSPAWLDLAAEPIILTVPAIGDRYYSFQLIDMYTFNFGYVGTRTTGTAPGNYMITGPTWRGQTPPGISKVFTSEGRYVYCLGRTAVNGEGDLGNVHDIQQQYRLRPLNEYLGSAAPITIQAEHYPEYNSIKGASADFIGYFNWLLGRVAIHPLEQDLIDWFGNIGIGPDWPYDPATVDEATRDAINQGVQSALSKIYAQGRSLGEQKEGWNLPGRVFGSRQQMHGQYLIRAAAAMTGLYGNDLEEAYYPSSFQDVDLEFLDGGKHNYVLRFPADRIPQVNAFWSITMYNSENFLVKNPVNRYSIGDRTAGLVYDQDGSLSMYLQKTSPGLEKEMNWLPTPAAPFTLTMRMYMPDPSALDPLYSPPGIRKVD